MLKVLEPNLRFSILGAGCAWPEVAPLTNRDVLMAHPETADKPPEVLERLERKLTEGNGTYQRFCVRKPWEPLLPEHQAITSETLGLAALRKAVPVGATPPEALVFGSTTSCRYTGSQAAAILGKMESEASAFEVKAGCSTSLVSLQLGFSLLGSGYDRVAVCGAETLSKVCNSEVRESWFGLGDGSGALVLARDSHGPWTLEKMAYGSDGVHVELATTPGGLPPTLPDLENNNYVFKGDYTKLKDLAFFRYRQLIETILPDPRDRATLTWAVPHQVNRQIIDFVFKETGVSPRQILWSADRYGNIGGSSILFTLAENHAKGTFQSSGSTDLTPKKMLLLSVGGGLTFAGQLWSFTG